MAKAKTLLDDVLARVKPTITSIGWWHKLPADVLGELEQMRSDYAAGKYADTPKTALAKAIAESLEARGYRMPHHRRITEWLDSKRM